MDVYISTVCVSTVDKRHNSNEHLCNVVLCLCDICVKSANKYNHVILFGITLRL